jgi:hypothetical protein
MSSRESALGAWADKIPRVDGWTEPTPAWNQLVVEESPLTVDEADRQLKQAGLLLLMGLAPVLIAGGMLLSKLDVILHGEVTSATIVDLQRGRKGYFPVAAFYVNGQRYLAHGGVSTRDPIHDLGDTVAVRYVPGDPNRAYMDGFMQLYLFPTILAVVGLVFIIMAVVGGAQTVRRASVSAHA